MSSISSTAGSGISQFLQNLVANVSSSSNASSGSTTASNSSTGATTGHHHHHHGGGGGFDKLASAVTSALQAATSSGSSSNDANQTITQALTKIFQNGSVDSGDDSSDSSTPASNNAQTGAAATSSTNGLPAAFVQTLQSFGVTAQQFQADFTNALKSAQESGSADLSQAFKSFPAGSVVDTVG